MRKKKYGVILTEIEREGLYKLIEAGTAPARKLTYARVLLKADQSPGGPGWADEHIAEAVEVSQPTISHIRKQYVRGGRDSSRGSACIIRAVQARTGNAGAVGQIKRRHTGSDDSDTQRAGSL